MRSRDPDVMDFSICDQWGRIQLILSGGFPGLVVLGSIRKQTEPGSGGMPVISALGRPKQVDLCEFKASLVYRASSRTSSKATEKPCLEQP